VRPLLALVFLATALSPSASPALDPDGWLAPPAAARPVARWWWPGGAVDEAGIRAELQRIHAAGFGAVEVQPLLLGMSDADLAADPRIRSVGSPEFVRHVASAARQSAALGLAFDLTLGSGWPGGLPGREDAAERQLLMASLDLKDASRARARLPAPEPPTYVADVQRFLDTMGPFDPDARRVAVLALRLANGGPPARFDRVEVLSDRVRDGRIDWQVPPGRWRLLVFYENRTGHSVLGGAYPGAAHDASTVDHLSARGAQALWSGYVEPILAAAPRGSIRSVFIDSFELVGELPWTAGLRDLFRSRKGYDLTPHLPLLFRKGGESKYSEMVDFLGRNGGPVYVSAEGSGMRARVREDYEEVREALFLEQFLGTFVRLAQRHGIGIRLQAHGGFGDTLDAYAMADVPESEGLFAGGSTDFLKLASSAAHVAGRRLASSESFITLRFYGHQLEPRELDLLAGRALGAGINQIVYHGVPYRYQRSDGGEWYPFIGGFGRILAGPLPMTTWLRGALWDALPDINERLARLTFAMQQGEHVADLAWLRSEAAFPDAPSFEFGRVDPHEGESVGSRALRGRGLVYDRVSRRQLQGARIESGRLRVGAARYRALLLDPIHAAQPELVQRVLAIARAGIPVLAIGALPTRAPGLADARTRDSALREGVSQLQAAVMRIPGEEGLAEALRELELEGPLVAASGKALRFSVEHRRTRDEHILLVFNESWSNTRQRLRLNVGGGDVAIWDPRTGAKRGVAVPREGARTFELALEPAQSIILTVSLSPERRLRATDGRVSAAGPPRRRTSSSR
jgi:hypothetical protein